MWDRGWRVWWPARGDDFFQFRQRLFQRGEIAVAVVREDFAAARDHLREHVAEHALALGAEADEKGALVAAAALPFEQAFLFQPFDHAGQRALGDQRLLAQLLVRHAGRVAQRGDDVELGVRQAALAHMVARQTLEALHALGQQPDTFQIAFTHGRHYSRPAATAPRAATRAVPRGAAICTAPRRAEHRARPS